MLGLIRIFLFYPSWLINIIFHTSYTQTWVSIGLVELYIKSTDVKELECMKRNFLHLCQNCFFIHDEDANEELVTILHAHNLHNRRRLLDALFCISVYSGFKCVPLRFGYYWFSCSSSYFQNVLSRLSILYKNSPSAGWLSAANRFWAKCRYI